MRVQLEFDDRGVKLLERLKQDSGTTTYKELFNNALTLLDWALTQRMQGRTVASLDERSGDFRELQMPVLEYSATSAKLGSRWKKPA